MTFNSVAPLLDPFLHMTCWIGRERRSWRSGYAASSQAGGGGQDVLPAISETSTLHSSSSSVWLLLIAQEWVGGQLSANTETIQVEKAMETSIEKKTFMFKNNFFAFLNHWFQDISPVWDITVKSYRGDNIRSITIYKGGADRSLLW